jgi:hypothetical protein
MAIDTNRPWRNDRRWAKGFFVSANALKKLVVAWTIALPLSLALCLGFALEFAWDQVAVGKIIVAVCLPAAASAAFLAGYLTAQFVRYGSPRLALAEMPVVPGRVLRGIVLCRRSVDVKGSYRLMVTCQRVVMQRRKAVPVTVFQRISCVSAEQDMGGAHFGAAIPVELPVEAGLPDMTSDVTWKLVARAATPGVKFEAEFDLPVFRVENEGLIEKRPEGK